MNRRKLKQNLYKQKLDISISVKDDIRNSKLSKKKKKMIHYTDDEGNRAIGVSS